MPSLRDYLPVYEKNYKELKSIQEALDPEIYGESGAYTAEESLDNDLFILSASAQGISRFEKILKITPASTDSLEARRARVLIKWNNRVPYTMRVLISKLNNICGIGNYELDTSELTSYLLYIITHFSKDGEAEALDTILKMMIPANLRVVSKSQLERTIDIRVRMGSATMTRTTRNIDTRTSTEVSVSGTMTGAGIVTTYRTRVIN